MIQRALRTWVQPHKLIQSRYREAGTTWAVLECGHTEPATGLDLSTSLRCQQCNPIPRTPSTPQEGWE
ncbi:MAG: hypothetical protein ACXV2H_07145 [Actinomycetes bacterium]